MRGMHLRLLPTLMVSTTFALSDPLTAADHQHRQHDTHVHGNARLDLAREGPKIQLEFNSPAANIVGFEHHPSSAADRLQLEQAITTLKQGGHLFRFSREAQCRQTAVQVESPLLEYQENRHDHTDITAVYAFHCQRPEQLRQLKVELFAAFPATERLRYQYASDNGQTGGTLTARRPTLQLEP